MNLFNLFYKNKILLFILIVFTIVLFIMLSNVYAGKPVISLNSPVSFPVDI